MKGKLLFCAILNVLLCVFLAQVNVIQQADVIYFNGNFITMSS